jgi:hypothetical protein
MKLANLITWQSYAGKPIVVQGTTITPESWAFHLQTPFGGWVWNRPIAVLVERDGKLQRIPIVDVTLAVILGMVAFSTIISILAFVGWSTRSSKSQGVENDEAI